MHFVKRCAKVNDIRASFTSAVTAAPALDYGKAAITPVRWQGTANQLSQRGLRECYDTGDFTTRVQGKLEPADIAATDG